MRLVVLRDRARALAPGLGISLIVATAATFLAQRHTAPVMLYALLLGMALNFVTEAERARSGVEFAARGLLRVGVALLGARIGWAQVSALGWAPVAIVITLVVVVTGASVLLARALRFHPLFGLLSGGATAICGASAALALSAALPAHPKKDQATLYTVVGVSVLSTVAMIVYPLIAHVAGLDDRSAGIFIGATIHDVAQVVGAGYAVSPLAGDTATVVKLLRVAMLLPVIVVAGVVSRRGAAEAGTRPPLVPGFVVGFVALVLLNSLALVPPAIAGAASDFSRLCLVTAMAAIGIRTRLGDLVKLGLRPAALMFAQTVLLALLVLALLKSGLS